MNEFPRRLYHKTPAWVESGAMFHIRIRVGVGQSTSLITPALARDLLQAAERYHKMNRWWCGLILLMPDHLHALLVFPGIPGMSACLRDWKRGTARFQRVKWQGN